MALRTLTRTALRALDFIVWRVDYYTSKPSRGWRPVEWAE